MEGKSFTPVHRFLLEVNIKKEKNFGESDGNPNEDQKDEHEDQKDEHEDVKENIKIINCGGGE